MSKNPFLLTKNDILDAFNSIVNSDELKAIEDLQSNLNFLSSRNANSNALDALQGYGVTACSPSWNITHNIEPSSTPSSSTSCKPFSSLNLNSVEEEDEFLYGDSNSVPEEQLSVKEESIINTTGRNDSGWSDEEDPYGDLRPLSKLNSRLRKNKFQSQNKFQENINRVHINTSSREISAQKYASHKLQSDDSVLSSEIEKNIFSEISSTSGGTKSKYHAAAEILKNRTVEKSNLNNNSSSEKLSVFPGTSKNSSELGKSLQSDLKTDKSAAKKPIPRTINKKHIDNIRDYITGAPQRKSAHLHEDFPTEKHPRYETSRTSSFSPSRHHSPHRPSIPNNKARPSHTSSESDYIRYASSHSRPRSQSFESEKRHHSRYSERRYSPSPKRWSRSPDYRHHRRSREKSSEYSRYKDRSPRVRRSRSRSPGYYSSRNKTYDKKQRSKSPKKTDYSTKKKEKYSSGDSYCSLSLGSSSSSSSDSSDSSDEKKSSRKSPAKAVPRDNRKLEDEIINLKASTDSHSKKSDSAFQPDDLSKKLSNIFNVKDDGNNLQLDSASINQLLNASLPNREQQLIMNFLEHQMQPQQQPIVVSGSLTFTSPSITGINIASNMQMMSSSDSYAYPSVPAAPVQYVAPQVPSFSPMIHSAAYPAPVMAAPTPAEYGPYLTVPPVPANDSQYLTNIVTNEKRGKVSRPPTLRTIPMSDNLHVSPTSSSNITVVPTNSSLQKSATTSKVQESKASSQKSAKLSLDNKTKNLKEKTDEKNIGSSSKYTGESASSKAESTSEKNKVLIIDKFKRMKAERASAQKKAKSAAEDLDEMRKMLDETFGRKPSPSDKMLYSRCENQFNLSLDTASKNNKHARRLDESLNNFKARLPTALQIEVSKLKVEPYIEEPTNEIVSCLDQGDHRCCDCCICFNDIKEMLNHIKAADHKEQMEANLQEWKKDFVKKRKEDQNNDKKKTVLKPVKGAEFLKPLTGFYCALCKEVFIEEADAEQHLKGHQHYTNYDACSTGHLNINSLPEEMLLEIFSYLTQNELAQIGRVCKDWQKFSKCSIFWIKVDVKMFWHSSSQTEAISSFSNFLPSSATHINFNFIPDCKDSAKACDFTVFCVKIEEKYNLKILIFHNVQFKNPLKNIFNICTRYLPSVTEVVFRSCKFPMASGIERGSLVNIETLDICDCRGESCVVLPYFNMPRLKKLYLANLVLISVNYPLMDNPFMDQLQILNVHGTVFGYYTLQAVKENAHNLTELYVCNNDVLADEHFQFNNVFQCLKKICVAGISLLTCEGIVSLIKSCPSLEDVFTDEDKFQAYVNHPSVEGNLLQKNIVKYIQNCHHYRDIDYMSHS